MYAQHIYGTAKVGGTYTGLTRIAGWDGSPVTQADIASITYTAYGLCGRDNSTREAVDGHEDVAVDVDGADGSIFDALQTDDRWTEDDTGYNFRHTPDVSENALFTTPEKNYLIEYTLTPTSGQAIVVTFHVHAI